jgi:hypothetical protein
MKNLTKTLQLICVIFLCLFTTKLYAQQWSGPANTTGDIFRLGRVGIGMTVAPSHRLQLSQGNMMFDYGNGNTTGNLYFGGQSDLNVNGMRMFYLNSGLAGGFIDVRVTAATDGLKFRVDQNNGGIERMRISANGNVGIGIPVPNYLLHVAGTGRFNTTLSVGTDAAVGNNLNVTNFGYFGNSSSPAGSGVLNAGTTTGTASAGISAYQGVWNNGVGVTAAGGKTGVFGVGGAYHSTGTQPQEVVGVWGYGDTGSLRSIGVHGDGFTNQASQGYGVLGSGYGCNSYGVYGEAPAGCAYAGYFQGDLAYTGTFGQGSDRKLKQNIVPLRNALDRIMALQPSQYEFRTEEFPSMNLSSGTHFGLIAQELEETFPTLVRDVLHPAQYDSKNEKIIAEAIEYKNVNYMELIPVLISGMQEQQAIIEDQNKKIEELYNLISVAQYNTSTSSQNSQVKSSFVFQNQPNPASAGSRIPFIIASEVKDAVLTITDGSGRVIVRESVTQRGSGFYELDTQSFAKGSYVYSLFVDGVPVGVMQMIIE